MSSVPGSSAVSADGTPVIDYDTFAEAYTAENETSLVNGYRSEFTAESTKHVSIWEKPVLT